MHCSSNQRKINQSAIFYQLWSYKALKISAKSPWNQLIFPPICLGKSSKIWLFFHDLWEALSLLVDKITDFTLPLFECWCLLLWTTVIYRFHCVHIGLLKWLLWNGSLKNQVISVNKLVYTLKLHFQNYFNGASTILWSCSSYIDVPSI